MYKDSIWAREIIAKQGQDGAWGYFHTLSEPDKHSITTEQALRRLSMLGYTMEDEPIQKAVSYMSDCLTGKNQTPDRREKLHDWDIFTDLMLSTWIRRFVNTHKKANSVASVWADIVSRAFSKGGYAHTDYLSAYQMAFRKRAQGGRLVDFVSFYQVSLLADQFDEGTESRVVDYILNKADGIYYIYGQPLSVLPECFASKQTSRYLGAVELLAQYRRSLPKLKFTAEWLARNQNEAGRWDMGSGVKDHVYFPLSDSWKNRECRELDCTYRIQALLSSLDKAPVA